MRKLLVCLLLPLVLALACSSAPSSKQAQAVWEPAESLRYTPSVADVENTRQAPQGVSGKTAFQYLKDERILCGWNLGNSLDAHSDGWAEERRWGNPVISQELLNGVKAAGFDIVRIPVTWMGHIGGAPDNHVEQARLERVAEVVDMAHNAGLKVIINLHHDGATESSSKEPGWLSVGKASSGKLYGGNNDYGVIGHQFVRVWVQIANYFKNYGDWLFFESMNEIHDGGWGYGYLFRADPASQYEILNQWNQLFTDAVRACGGNNEHRFLVIPSYAAIPECTYPGGSIKNGPANVGDLFKLPEDSSPGKQIVTFHYYRPDEVGLGHSGGRANWGTPADRQQIDDDFTPFKAAYIDNNIPVIIGETGAVQLMYPGDSAKEAAARESRRNYLAYIFSAAKKFGLIPIYWDNGAISGGGEKFGLLDRNTGRPGSPESSALINTMVNAAK